MDKVQRKPYARARFVLLAGMILMAATITQCKMVTDAATRPQVDPTAAGNCVSACAHAANEAMKAESDLHTSNIKACGKNNDCKKAESERHVAAVQAIQDQRKACQNACHHQGGGRGGR